MKSFPNAFRSRMRSSLVKFLLQNGTGFEVEIVWKRVVQSALYPGLVFVERLLEFCWCTANNGGAVENYSNSQPGLLGCMRRQ